jgi:hypothetical protein
MKRTSRISILTLLSLLIFSFSTKSQIRDFGNFVVGGPEDAEKLFSAYMSPYINGLGASLSGGWYNTAKPHKLGGFDITLTINSAIVPAEFKSFDVDNLELNSLVRATGTAETSPTGAGENSSGPLMRYNLVNQSGDIVFDSSAFALPPGTGFGIVPSAMIQAGIGLFKGTEILGRYMPELGNNKGKIGFWGIGLKHDIKQWIPGLKRIPVLNIAVMGGYTKMNSYVSLDVDPSDLNLDNIFPDTLTWESQKLVFTSSSFTANLIVSADLKVVCFYGGVGFATTKANLLLEGDFPMILGVDEASYMPIAGVVHNPIEFEVKNYEGSRTKPRLNVGMRLKLGFVTLHADYTRAKYNMVSAGLGLSFR